MAILKTLLAYLPMEVEILQLWYEIVNFRVHGSNWFWHHYDPVAKSTFKISHL